MAKPEKTAEISEKLMEYWQAGIEAVLAGNAVPLDTDFLHPPKKIKKRDRARYLQLISEWEKFHDQLSE